MEQDVDRHWKYQPTGCRVTYASHRPQKKISKRSLESAFIRPKFLYSPLGVIIQNSRDLV